ncbi:MAG TPA: hypothetical protein VF668_02680 [Pyrinomonadaceae bacterium]|jgi:hypothetical protein
MFKSRSTFGSLLAAARQRMHPPEFRIGEPLWPRETADELGEALKRFAAVAAAAPPTPAAGAPAAPPVSAPAAPPAAAAGLFDEQIAAIGTMVWRLRNEIVKQADGPQAASLRYAASYLDALWGQLSDAGVEIRDHTGEAVPRRGVYLLKTVAHQPVSGIKHQLVIETLKPTIYFNEKILQVGEVIVGTPNPSN